MEEDFDHTSTDNELDQYHRQPIGDSGDSDEDDQDHDLDRVRSQVDLDPANLTQYPAHNELDAVNHPRKKTRLTALHPAVKAAHPATSGVQLLRAQHVHNLVACMRHFVATREDKPLLSVLIALTVARPRESLPPSWQLHHRHHQGRVSEVVRTAYGMFLRHGGYRSSTQLQGLLRKILPYQASAASKGRLKIECARISLREHRTSEAYDTLAAIGPLQLHGDREGEHRRQCLLGGIKMYQWEKAMSRALYGRQETTTWDRYGHEPGVWARLGRSGKEFHKDALIHFLEAKKHSAASMAIYYNIIRLYLVQGSEQNALKTSFEATETLPNDVDAECLELMLRTRALVLRRAVDDEEYTLEITLKTASKSQLRLLVRKCDAILQSDPHNAFAVSFAVAASKHLAVDDVEGELHAARALCTYISTTMPQMRCDTNTLRSWRCLKALIIRCSTALVEAADAFEGVRREARDALPLDNEAEPKPSLFRCRLEFDRTTMLWGHIVSLLQHHSWWLCAHLQLPTSNERVKETVDDGLADVETLSVLAFMRYALAEVSTETLAMPLGGNEERLDAVLSYLEERGHTALVEDLQSSVASFNRAHCIESKGFDKAVESLSVAVSLAKAQELATAGAKAHSMVSVWQPMPLGTSNADGWVINEMPSSWWASFPWFRRREKRDTQDGE